MDLHSLRPYDFRKADDATYYFETENGLKYRAYFIELSATFYKLYSFSFEKQEGKVLYDQRIKDTIVTVLADFFASENYILGYTCDITDGREMARKRLFDRWFQQANSVSLRKIDFQTDNIYVSLIVNRNYFAIDAAVQDINQWFVDILSQK
ncbi:MAG: DUF6169 family protein [Paludibacteraceae bacterium]